YSTPFRSAESRVPWPRRRRGVATGDDPESIRKAADDALQQARHAFDEARIAAERAVDALKGGQPGLEEAARATLAHSGEMVDDALDYLQRLVAAERPESVLALQQDYFRKQMIRAPDRTRRLAEAAMRIGTGLG